MNGELALTAGMLALLTVQVIKWGYRRWGANDPDYSFTPRFYQLLIPFATAAWGVGLGLSGFADPVAISFQSLVSWGLAVLVELVLYNAGVQPFNDFRRTVNGS